MTYTLTGADIRGYYGALGIHLNRWSRIEASVRCFVDPDAHRRGDRDPSCSINLEHGAFHCHGCGATGGAYDAAIAHGYSAREAIDLMVAFGLTEHRDHDRGPVTPGRSAPRPAPQLRQRAASNIVSLSITEDDVIAWQGALAADRRLLARLYQARGWTYRAVSALGLGLDRGQITIPTHDEHGQLTGLLRYRPWPRPGEPKLTAAAGSHRVLLPHPAAEPSKSILLVEGEPDMIAARSRGWPAIAIPGIDTWRPEWANLFSGRDVTIITDADRQGRQLAHQVAHDLANIAEPTVLDLAPERNDGYDLTDWLVARSGAAANLLAQLEANTTSKGAR